LRFLRSFGIAFQLLFKCSVRARLPLLTPKAAVLRFLNIFFNPVISTFCGQRGFLTGTRCSVKDHPAASAGE
jgi:hypothetical protein